ncbi:VOC family protein [Hwanghaeella grinnelliae]|uniref:Bleomycin resistance protein n=1 Tax=Hwanghaeella grinnelliae TaxID=2500179 RepID=A0A3S2ZBJ7_9PROT|nr:VOC family protein [Hwanghaeella grinnelliae]RVU38820.1 VOC family protein [Hwanghaeella grinnelliae]
MSSEPVNVAIPILPSSDTAAAVAFWQGLGFEIGHVFGAENEGGGYGIVRDGEVEFHFLDMADSHVAQNTSCYIRVSDVDAWFDRLAPKVKAPARVSEEPLDREWGMREFYIWDRDGVLFKFGQVLD